MVRVLHLIATFGAGGAERQLALIAPALAARGVEVHVGYCRGGPNLARLEGSGVVLHPIAAERAHSPLLAARIYRLLRRSRPDVVQTWLLQMDVLGGALALAQRIPLIVSERSSAAAYAPGWKTRLRRQVGQRAAAVVANSLGGVAYWQPVLPAERLHLVRNCVVPAPALAHCPPDAPPRNVPLVLFAGRFSYEKNIPGLIEALILAARRRPDLQVRLFGDGPERAAAQRRVAQAGLEHRLVIEPHTDELGAWMARAAACVSLSHFEGHPNVVMEAAAARCPLVLSDIAAHRELFDERTAWLAPPGAPEQAAAAIVEAIENRPLAAERAAQALALAEPYGLPATCAAYRDVYARIARARPFLPSAAFPE